MKKRILFLNKEKFPANQLYYSDLARTIDYSAGKTMTVVFKAGSASSSLVGDVQIVGPLYANSSGFKINDGTNTASFATSWASGDVVTAKIQTYNDGVRTFMRVSRG